MIYLCIYLLVGLLTAITLVWRDYKDSIDFTIGSLLTFAFTVFLWPIALIALYPEYKDIVLIKGKKK